MNTRTFVKRILYRAQQNPLSLLVYENELKKRAKLELIDIEGLSKPINIFSPSYEIHKPNEWYGHASIFKNFLNLPKSYIFKFTIEHGMHLTNSMLNLEKESLLPSVVTYSQFRKKAITPSGKKAFCVGPFIHYAPHYLSKSQLQKEKKKLGKVLLVFPSHSSVDFALDYDVQEFLKKVRRIAKDFDTVRICLYWKDVLRGRAANYSEYECVSAGHIMDPMFLPRLKSIIETSDLGVSSVAGNHVGYSLFMGKPHVILPQKHTISGNKSEKKLIEDAWWKEKSYVEILKAFSNYSDKISSDQKKIIGYYWGFSEIKTKREFLDIVKETEKLYSKENQK